MTAIDVPVPAQHGIPVRQQGVALLAHSPIQEFPDVERGRAIGVGLVPASYHGIDPIGWRLKWIPSRPTSRYCALPRASRTSRPACKACGRKTAQTGTAGAPRKQGACGNGAGGFGPERRGFCRWNAERSRIGAGIGGDHVNHIGRIGAAALDCELLPPSIGDKLGRVLQAEGHPAEILSQG